MNKDKNGICCEEHDFWRIKFGVVLKTLFDIYEVRDIDFSEYSENVNHPITDSAVRKWFSGKRLPRKESLKIIIRFFESLSSTQKNDKKERQIYASIENYFSEQYLSDFYRIQQESSNIVDFIRNILQHCTLKSIEPKLIANSQGIYCSSGQIKAVVFDFDGTLTYGKTNRTTWESIWTSLEYDVAECQDLQRRFIHGEFSHDEWCKLTEEKFVAKHLHKAEVEKIAKRIKLLPGVKDTFSMLEARDIKIYIVSGSIFDVIKKVLGSSVYHYVDGIKANYFFYNDCEILSKIVGTKYDFEGKANFIREVAAELQISTKDILFVGNSFNDRFAYQSGARTLCINPKDTDPTDFVVWNYCISECKNLKDIIQYIDDNP